MKASTYSSTQRHGNLCTHKLKLAAADGAAGWTCQMRMLWREIPTAASRWSLAIASAGLIIAR